EILYTIHKKIDDAAIQRVIHGSVPPPPRVEGLAWLVRARVEWHDGRKQDAVDALRKAEQLATDPITRRHVYAAQIDFGLQERPVVSIPPGQHLPRLDHRRKSPAAKRETQPVVLLRRKTWGSRRSNPAAMVAMGRPSRITVHHSAMYLHGSLSQAAQQVRSFQRGHMKRGWGDIGYHFLVDPSGRVFEGRSLRYQGAHAGDERSNRGNIGICVLGNFQPYTQEPTQRPSPAQVAGLESLIRFCCEQFGIAPQRIYTHKEVHPRGPGATLCPGTHLIPIVRRIRNRLRAHPVASR
ncbi:MAG: peptidoglycan recognition family protein, partial [Planctomycetota bacterium]